MSSDFDDILTSLGTGKWTIFYFLGFCLLNFMLPGIYFGGSFVAPSVNFTCDTQEPDDVIQDIEKCQYSVLRNSTNQTVIEISECSNWIYDDEYFPNTLTSELDLVCDSAYRRPTYQTMMVVGNIVGAPVNGYLADRFGRKTLLIYSLIICTLAVILQTFTTIYHLLLFLRFWSGFFAATIYFTGYILCMEVCQPKHRTTLGIITSVPWALGNVWWGALGYLIRDWRWLMRADVLPAILGFIWLCLIDDSPRWLIVRGHLDRAVSALQRLAKRNDSHLSSDEELLIRVQNIEKDLKIHKVSELKDSQASLKSRIGHGFHQIVVLYRTPEIRKRVLIIHVLYVVNASVYYGITLNGMNYDLNPFFYMAVSGLSEIPAYTLTIPLISKFGRVHPIIFCYVSAGITILILAFIPSDPAWVTVLLSMVGKCAISSAFIVMILLSVELIPTEVRLHAIGTSSFIGNCGALVCPYITDLLGSQHHWIPSVIFGVLSILAAIFSFIVPETKDVHLPETIRQLEQIRKQQKQTQQRIEDT